MADQTPVVDKPYKQPFVIAFVGATSFEFQIGRLWITVCRPGFWIWGCRPWIKIGLEPVEEDKC